jgi:hypothetical protein
VLFHLIQSFPKVKTVPVHKKHRISSNMHEINTYYNEKYTFIYDKSSRRLIACFQNVAIVLLNDDENENKLLFGLACKPDWNDNKDIKYATITSELTVQNVRKTRNNLDEISGQNNDNKPTILVGKRVVAYTITYPRVVYYKLLKSIEGLRWIKDSEVNLYDMFSERKKQIIN